MDFEEIEKKNLNFYSPRFEIEIDGQDLLKLGAPITSVEVNEKLNESTRFSLQIDDHYDIGSQTFQWLDNPVIHVGKNITIKMGYGANLHTMIVGKIETINSSMFSSGPPSLKVEGYDLAYSLLKKASEEEEFNNMKDSDIVSRLAGKIGLTAVVDPTTEVHEKLIKNASYFNFLKQRAARIGYEFYVSARSIYFVKSKEDPEELFTLEWGKSLFSFSPSMSTAGIITEVESRGGWDAKNKKEIKGKAQAGDENTQEKGKKKGSEYVKESGVEVKKVIYYPVSSEEEAVNISKTKLNKASDGFIEGSGSTIGIPELRSGILIMLDRLGKRFSGKYRVKEVTHTIDSSGYKVNFIAKRNAG